MAQGQTITQIKQMVKPFLPPVVRAALRYSVFRISALGLTLRERAAPPRPGDIPVPPPLLRNRVHGNIDLNDFLVVGETCAADLNRSLSEIGKRLDDFDQVLDFGCGCGRVLRHLVPFATRHRLYGTDIDHEAVAWCRQNLPSVSLGVNGPLPPLPYPDGTLDLIYVFSVFTHLNEEYQFAWLKELKRVLKRGGILVASTHGVFAQDRNARAGLLTNADLETLREKGVVFTVGVSETFKLDGLPAFYQAAYHTRRYISERWGQFFTLRHYREQGLNNHQDLVLLANE